jgi:epoxyqueuosine reductase
VNPRELVRAKARELGFDAVGIARADEPLGVDFARYEAFVAAGLHGSMHWLAADAEVRARLDGEGILPGAKSVVCLARRYQRASSEEAGDPPLATLIARYARGRDYHNFLRKKLRRMAVLLRSLGSDAAPVEARPMVDDAPILERAWAARAGLGFVGKNGLLIVPGEGSMVLLGEVVTTLAIEPDAPMAERCGSCTRCLEACPTQAFAAPWVLDARKCVSYLTIEHRGPIAAALKPGIGEHLFGCDDCQTVCPFNGGRRAAVSRDAERHAPDERWSTLDLVALLFLDDEGFAALTRGSPVHRATRGGLVRNAALVLGHRGDKDALGALARVVREDPDLGARDAAAWAIARLASLPD